MTWSLLNDQRSAVREEHWEKTVNYPELQSTRVDLWAGTALGVGALILSMMNRLTANSSLPRGPAVKLASLAGRSCFLRRSQDAVSQEEGGHRLFVSAETSLGQACLFGEGVWTAHKSIKSIRVLGGDGLARPGLRELGPIFCEGLCESERCHGQQARLVYSQHQHECREEGWKACIWPEPLCHIWARVHIGLRCSHQWTCEDCRVVVCEI